MIAGHLPNSIGVIDGETWISTPEGNRPVTQADIDAYAQSQQQARGVQAQRFNADPAMTQFTPDQVRSYLADPNGFIANNTALLGGKGIWNDNLDGSGTQNLWAGPEGVRTNGANLFTDSLPWSSAGRTDFNNMLPGLSIMALPFAALAGTAAVGAAGGTGAAGGGAAGAAEGGTAAGAGATGYESLIGGAGEDTLGGASMPAAQFEDPLGGYNIDPNTGDVFHGTGDNPFGSNFSGGDTNAFFNGTESGVDPSLLQRAQDMAKQYGITPASALSLLKQGAGLLGKAAPAALGVVGATKQQNSLEALAQKYLDLGAPSRTRYEASFAPGFTMENDPGYMDALNQASKATLHGLSVNGNPAGSPNAWAKSLSDNYAKTAYPALQNFRNTNANAGGIASLQTSAPGFDTGAVNAGKGVFDAVGGGINDIFNPKPSLAQTIAEYKRLMGTV